MANRRFLVGLNGNNYINIGTHEFTEGNEIQCIYALDDQSKIWYRASRNNWHEYPMSAKNYRYKVRYGISGNRFCFFLPNYTEDETERLGTGLNLLLFADAPITQAITGDFFEDVTTYEEGLYIHEGETRGNVLYFIYMPQPDASDRWAEFYSINNTYDDLPEYKYGGMPLLGNIVYTQGMTEHEFTFTIDKPIFSNIADVKKYLETGEIGPSCINKEEEEATEVNINNEYYITNVVKKNGEVISSKNYKFAIDNGARISMYAETPHAGTASAPNCHLRITAYPFKYMEGTNPLWITANILSEELSQYFYNERWTDYSNGDNYISNLYTNIPIFKSLTDAQKYEEGLITDDEAIAGGGGEPAHPSSIGNLILSNDVNTQSHGYAGSTIYCISKNELLGFFDYIFNPDQTLIDSLKNGLWMWGSNPADAIINIYYIPFDAKVFYETRSRRFKLGSHIIEESIEEAEYHSTLTEGGKTITLFSEFFAGTYGDYRDITDFKWDLFLPFLGFVQLDIPKYLNRIVSCKMMFDASTHNIRYFIFSNGVITDRFDCSCGIDMPFMATDNVNKAKSDFRNTLGVAGNVIGLGASVATGNIGGIISNTENIVGGITSIASKPAEQVRGAFSSSMNIYDTRFAYLRITEKNTIKPANLNTLYNYPSYYMGSISSLNGYCEIRDCRLRTTATEAEQNEILSLLASGVII